MKERLTLELAEVARFRELLRHDLEAWGIDPCASLVVSLPAKAEGTLDGKSGNPELIADAPAVDLLTAIQTAHALSVELNVVRGQAEGRRLRIEELEKVAENLRRQVEDLDLELAQAKGLANGLQKTANDAALRLLEAQKGTPKPPKTRAEKAAVFVRESEAHLEGVDRGKRMAARNGRRIFYIWFCPGDGTIVPSFVHRADDCDPDLGGAVVVERWDLSAGGIWDSRPLDREVVPTYATHAREAVRLG